MEIMDKKATFLLLGGKQKKNRLVLRDLKSFKTLCFCRVSVIFITRFLTFSTAVLFVGNRKLLLRTLFLNQFVFVNFVMSH